MGRQLRLLDIIWSIDCELAGGRTCTSNYTLLLIQYWSMKMSRMAKKLSPNIIILYFNLDNVLSGVVVVASLFCTESFIQIDIVHGEIQIRIYGHTENRTGTGY